MSEQSLALELWCPECDSRAEHDVLQTLCRCGRPWLLSYDLQRLDAGVWAEALKARPCNLWRYAELLPPVDPESCVVLGEGGTPLLELGTRRVEDGQVRFLLKQEAGNPTGSFKDRGLAVAINRARALGATRVELPSAGNAGIAASAYAAAAGVRCRVGLPVSTPRRVLERCREYGAEVIVSGDTLVDAGRRLAEEAERGFSLATLREPYRLEGKKTLAFELAEQMQWRVPSWIVFPTGGGTGIVAMHKAFGELCALGLVEHPPRLVAVQSDRCAPLVAAFEGGADEATPWPDPATEAWGLKVPRAVGDRLTLRALRESGGVAMAVAETEIAACARRTTRETGLTVGPEGAAALLAAEALVDGGQVAAGETLVVFQTGHPGNYR